MPRVKTKPSTVSAAARNKNNSYDNTNAGLAKKDFSTDTPKQEDISIKKEIPEISVEESSPSKAIDLSQFKFERKPHVKIEFEKDSPVTQETKGLWEPANWQEFLVNLRIMRANNDAPVDSMGCHMNMDENSPPEVYRYQCLISLMLSSQTKDQVTFAAMEKLRAKGLNIDNVLAMSDEELGQLIYPVGFWKTKVKYIKKTTQTLKEQYNGDIPDSVEKLCKLTGVGPKMAHICMKVAWDKITGIGVDTHVHRISNRIGWVKKTTTTPEDTRKALQSWLPFELWSEVNHLMVGFGQTICQPIGPMCHECLNRDICPSSGKGRKSPKKSPIKKIKQESSETIEDIKPPKARKVTPKKELSAPEDLKTIKTKKVTPRKELNNQQEETLRSADIKPSNIKKITPKKEIKPPEATEFVDIKPSKTRKVTPKKEVNVQENTSTIDLKPAETRKVTPKKELNMQEDSAGLKPTNTRKVNPRKKPSSKDDNNKLTQSQSLWQNQQNPDLNDFIEEKVVIHDKSPRKRKVTPKPNQVIPQIVEIGDQKTRQVKKRTPNKDENAGKMIPKLQSSLIDNMEGEPEQVTVKKGRHTRNKPVMKLDEENVTTENKPLKIPTKRKSPRNKDVTN